MILFQEVLIGGSIAVTASSLAIFENIKRNHIAKNKNKAYFWENQNRYDLGFLTPLAYSTDYIYATIIKYLLFKEFFSIESSDKKSENQLTNQLKCNNSIIPHNYTHPIPMTKMFNSSIYQNLPYEHLVPKQIKQQEKPYQRIIFTNMNTPNIQDWENAINNEISRIEKILGKKDLLDDFTFLYKNLLAIYPVIKEINDPKDLFAFIRLADDYLPQTIDVFEKSYEIAQTTETKETAKNSFIKQIAQLTHVYQVYIEKANKYREDQQRVNGRFLSSLSGEQQTNI